MLSSVISLFLLSFCSASYQSKGHHKRKLQIQSLDILAAKSIAQNLLSLIHNRYEMFGSIGSELFSTAANIGEAQWDMIKYKIALRALQGNQTYLMIFGGSSVTAGHDNYFNNSFPMIVQKRMQPLFNTLGVDLTVRNIAQGANNCNPYVMIYEAMGGVDPDFVHWEQVLIVMSTMYACISITSLIKYNRVHI